jgi:hypothetical protein
VFSTHKNVTSGPAKISKTVKPAQKILKYIHSNNLKSGQSATEKKEEIVIIKIIK